MSQRRRGGAWRVGIPRFLGEKGATYDHTARSARGITRSGPDFDRERPLAAALGCGAPAVIRHPAQAQTLGDLDQPLTSGREEAAEEMLLPQSVQP